MRNRRPDHLQRRYGLMAAIPGRPGEFGAARQAGKAGSTKPSDKIRGAGVRRQNARQPKATRQVG